MSGNGRDGAARVVAFVPAKGSSDRIPNKNLAILDGEHLFKRKLRQLLACPDIDEVYLDTESDAIAELAADLAIKRLVRPEGLASNRTDGHEMFAYECSQVEADIYIQALCTAPFVTEGTVGRALARLRDDERSDSLVAVRNVKQYRWDGGRPAYGEARIPNSVDLPATTLEAMSLYMVRRKPGEARPVRRFGRKPVLHELSEQETIDVNFPEDLELAEKICAGERAAANSQLQALRPFVTTSILADVCKDLQFPAALPIEIRPVSDGKFLGRAKTLQLGSLRPGESWEGIYSALDSYRFVRPGDVIVVATDVRKRAYFGDLNATLAIRAGAVGAVVDGLTRDTSAVNGLGFPVFARGATCVDIKYEGTLRAMNKPVVIGDVTVRNGDYVFADRDGVVVIPAGRWNEVRAKACSVMERESAVRLMAIRGVSIEQILARNGSF